MNRADDTKTRRYLLGAMSVEDARVFEDEYFVNRSLLLELQAAEAAPIGDYLRERLPAHDRAFFERRCDQTPDLKRKVELAGQEARRITVPQGPFTFRWRIAAAALITLMGIAPALYRANAPKTERHTSGSPGERRVVVVTLRPSVSMGEDRPAVNVTVSTDSRVEMRLELTGAEEHVRLPVSLLLIRPDGELQQVWAAGQPIESVADEHGESLTVRIDSAALQTGDYMVRAGAPGDRIHETFHFHATRSRQ